MIKYFFVASISSILTIIFVSIAFFNTPNKLVIGEKIVFRSDDGLFEYTTIPSKGRDYKMMEQAFINHKKKENIDGSVKLFRVTKKNYLNVSKWCSYKSLPEWNYPYKKI
jgi:hypothetical protein